MVGIYNYTVIATYCGMLSAVLGILFAGKGRFPAALFCLIFCGLIDSVDGTIARSKKNRTDTEKRFGIEIDSLSDLIAFGVLPACIVSFYTDSLSVTLLSLFYALCALIRLAFFDVLAHEKLLSGDTSSEYIGLPVTTCTWVLPVIALLSPVGPLSRILPAASGCILLVMGVLFITPFKIKKPGKKAIAVAAGLSVVLLALLVWETVSFA